MAFEKIPDPTLSELGPAMRTLTPLQRRFVIGWVGSGGKNSARVARAAGFSDKGGGAKVVASKLLRNPDVIAAIREEAGNSLMGASAMAVCVQRGLLVNEDPRVQQRAVDSVLDRTGFGRGVTATVRMEVTDPRPTSAIIVEARALLDAMTPGELERVASQFPEAVRALGHGPV